MTGIIGGGGDGGAGAMLAKQQADAEAMRKQAEAEKRDLNEQIASGRMARARGGARMLLSEQRINPEEGLSATTTLGA